MDLVLDPSQAGLALIDRPSLLINTVRLREAALTSPRPSIFFRNNLSILSWTSAIPL